MSTWSFLGSVASMRLGLANLRDGLVGSAMLGFAAPARRSRAALWSGARWVDALERDAEVEGQVRLQVVVRLIPTGRRDHHVSHVHEATLRRVVTDPAALRGQ